MRGDGPPLADEPLLVVEPGPPDPADLHLAAGCALVLCAVTVGLALAQRLAPAPRRPAPPASPARAQLRPAAASSSRRAAGGGSSPAAAQRQEPCRTPRGAPPQLDDWGVRPPDRPFCFRAPDHDDHADEPRGGAAAFATPPLSGRAGRQRAPQQRSEQQQREQEPASSWDPELLARCAGESPWITSVEGLQRSPAYRSHISRVRGRQLNYETAAQHRLRVYRALRDVDPSGFAALFSRKDLKARARVCLRRAARAAAHERRAGSGPRRAPAARAAPSRRHAAHAPQEWDAEPPSRARAAAECLATAALSGVLLGLPWLLPSLAPHRAAAAGAWLALHALAAAAGCASPAARVLHMYTTAGEHSMAPPAALLLAAAALEAALGLATGGAGVLLSLACRLATPGRQGFADRLLRFTPLVEVVRPMRFSTMSPARGGSRTTTDDIRRGQPRRAETVRFRGIPHQPVMARAALVALAALMLAGAASAQLATIEAWQQCGGLSREAGESSDAPWADASCGAGLTCARKTQYFWQCSPSAALYAQCGGKSNSNAALSGDREWAGCPAGSSCVRQTEFYWQCLREGETVAPAGAPQAPPATTASSGMRLAAPQPDAKKPAAAQARPLKSVVPTAAAAAATRRPAPPRSRRCPPRELRLLRCVKRSSRDARAGAASAARAAAAAAAAAPARREHAAASPPEPSGSGSGRRALLAAGALLPVAARAVPPPARAADCALATAASGLRWCDLAVGDGAAPIKGAFSKAHFTAQLASSGAVFYDSRARKAPLIFKPGANELVAAFDAAVLGAEDVPPMREGGTRRVVAPPGPLQRQGVKSLLWVAELSEAIEEAGLSADGTPTSDLVFEIELLPKRRAG
ncbi:FKBP13 [Scenedesmus sp. PABB004]|nr:FKBP13 [Scenedesmus sp. PABB004]